MKEAGASEYTKKKKKKKMYHVVSSLNLDLVTESVAQLEWTKTGCRGKQWAVSQIHITYRPEQGVCN